MKKSVTANLKISSKLAQKEIDSLNSTASIKVIEILLLLLLSHFSRVRSMGPHRRQPTRLPRPWDSPGKNTGVGCHFLLQTEILVNNKNLP